MEISMEEQIGKEMCKAINQFRRLLMYYQQWFVLYGDSLSDDIFSDIAEQAKQWAYLQVGLSA